MIHCPHRPPCPGCPDLGEPFSAHPRLADLRRIVRAAGAGEPELLSGPRRGFRTRARLAVRGRPGNPKIGIFQAGSHRIVDIPDCLLHDPRLNEAARMVREVLRRIGAAPYAEKPGTGLVRYLQLVVGRHSGKIQCTLVVTDASDPLIEPLTAELVAAFGESLHSLWYNVQDSRGNAILGPGWNLATGEPLLEDEFAGRRLHYHPGAFGQANPALAERMIGWIDDRVPPGGTTLEFHAGVGAIGLGLAHRADRYLLNEISPHALTGVRASLVVENAPANLELLPGPDTDHLDRMAEANLVICDPPRKGLAPSLVSAMRSVRPAKLILLHCGFDALVRDLEALREEDRFGLREMLAVDLFPHSGHLETVSVLTAS